MKPLKISEDILPLSEFKARAASILETLDARRSALVVTQNGRAACVVLSPAAFDRMQERQSFLEALAQGLQDVQNGNVVEDDDLLTSLDQESL